MGTNTGRLDGFADGTALGSAVGIVVGSIEGTAEGPKVGDAVGTFVGAMVTGAEDGTAVGPGVTGAPDGTWVGPLVTGAFEGTNVGTLVGTTLGTTEGSWVGIFEGTDVAVGTAVGVLVGIDVVRIVGDEVHARLAELQVARKDVSADPEHWSAPPFQAMPQLEKALPSMLLEMALFHPLHISCEPVKAFALMFVRPSGIPMERIELVEAKALTGMVAIKLGRQTLNSDWQLLQKLSPTVMSVDLGVKVMYLSE